MNMHKHASEQLIKLFNQELVEIRRKQESLELLMLEVEHEIRREAEQNENV